MAYKIAAGADGTVWTLASDLKTVELIQDCRPASTNLSQEFSVTIKTDPKLKFEGKKFQIVKSGEANRYQ